LISHSWWRESIASMSLIERLLLGGLNVADVALLTVYGPISGAFLRALGIQYAGSWHENKWRNWYSPFGFAPKMITGISGLNCNLAIDDYIC